MIKFYIRRFFVVWKIDQKELRLDLEENNYYIIVLVQVRNIEFLNYSYGEDRSDIIVRRML